MEDTMILTPWELVRKNKIEIMQMLQEDGCILLAMKNMGRRGGYNKPFAAAIQWPPPDGISFEVDGYWVMIISSKVP